MIVTEEVVEASLSDRAFKYTVVILALAVKVTEHLYQSLGYALIVASTTAPSDTPNVPSEILNVLAYVTPVAFNLSEISK